MKIKVSAVLRKKRRYTMRRECFVKKKSKASPFFAAVLGCAYIHYYFYAKKAGTEKPVGV